VVINYVQEKLYLSYLRELFVVNPEDGGSRLIVQVLLN
jgi:hypothetical protein